MASYQYVYQMDGVSKTYPGGKQVLKDIRLFFLPGAKIGVLGLNGAGKSTLMRVMAGIDTEINGEARAADGIKVGYLPQEPQLDPNKDVAGNVFEGVAETKALLDRFEEVSNAFAEADPDEMDKLIAEQAELQEKIDAADAWDLDRTVEIAMDALRCPPGDADVTKLSGGERRRVEIARALATEPRFILLDEPFAKLDVALRARFRSFVFDHARAQGLPTLLVTHDPQDAADAGGPRLQIDAEGRILGARPAGRGHRPGNLP